MKETVVVYDTKGVNFLITCKNAAAIVKSMLHSVKINYMLIDMRYSATPKQERAEQADIIFYVDM